MNHFKGFRGFGFLIMMILSAMWLTGCIEWTEKTKIYPDLKCSENIEVATNPIFAEGLRGESKKKEFEDMGYKVEMKTENEKVLMILSRDFKSVSEMYKKERLDPVSGVEGNGRGSKTKGELKVNDLFFVKTLTFREIRPPAETFKENSQNPKNNQTDEMKRDFAQNVFTFKKVVEMPGMITSSNGKVDKKTNSATWDVSFADIEKGCTFEVTSRIINIHAIIGISVVFVAIILAVIVIGMRKKGSPLGKS